MALESYRDLEVWKEGIALAEACYRLTQGFPREEIFELTAQIRRAASSVPANVAEGYGRESTRDWIRFLRIAQGSLKELETHLILGRNLEFGPKPEMEALLARSDRLGRMLRGLIRSLQKKPAE